MFIIFLSSTVDSFPKLKFNSIDFKYHVNRISFFGAYEVNNGKPINPVDSKTNRTGRHYLNYWGPNQSIKAIFTRYLESFIIRIYIFLIKLSKIQMENE
jgi:hypothetical protein